MWVFVIILLSVEVVEKIHIGFVPSLRICNGSQ